MRALHAESARLTDLPRLSLQALADRLGGQQAQFDIEQVEHCASTNDALATRPAGPGMTVLVAARQSAGRGRRGRPWQSPPGTGLTFSCGWTLPVGTAPAGLSLVVGLAVAEALETLGARDIALKWPNDVLAAGAKLAGILIELGSGPLGTRRAIIGIGINLRGTPGELPPGATALARHLAEPPADEAVLAAVLLHLQRRLQAFAARGFEAARADWQARDAFAGRAVRIIGDTGEQSGLCVGVDRDGALLLRDDAGTRRILGGDVSLRSAA